MIKNRRKKNELSVKDKSFKKLNKKQLSADDKKKGGVTIKSKSVSKGKGKEVVKGSKNIERVSAKSLEKVSKGNSKKPVQESKKVEARYSEKDKKYIYPYKELSTDARRAVREWKHFGKTHPPRGIGYNEGGYKVRHDEMDKHFGKGRWGITWEGKVYNPKLKS